MAMTQPLRSAPIRPTRRRGIARVGLGALTLLGLAGCFEDNFVPMDGTTGDSAGATTVVVDSGSTGAIDPDDSSGADSPGTSGDTTAADPTTAADTETDGSESDDGSSDSTGERVVLGVDELLPGDLVVTEVMWNPTCDVDDCEWIEIYNATDSSVNLLDLFIQDGDFNPGNQGRITDDVVVAPGDVALITRGLNFWPYAFGADSVYGPQPGFNNGRPERAVLLNSIEVLDETGFFDFGAAEGVAWSLSFDNLDAVSNDDPAMWCDAVDELPTFTTTEYGSPGELNPPC